MPSRVINGLKNNEFVMHYQPIVNLKTKGIAGYEALIRWNHPTKGLLYPDSFISLSKIKNSILKRLQSASKAS